MKREGIVPAYALAPTGALVGAVKSRVTWMKKQGWATLENRDKAIARDQGYAREHKAWAEENLAGVNLDFESPGFDLSALREAAEHLLEMHGALRDVAAFLFFAEEEEFNRGVVRLPTPIVVRDNMDKLTPNNRRRALGMIEQLLRQQKKGHERDAAGERP